MARPYKILGGRFGRLTVVNLAYQDERRKSFYLCLCDCGTFVIVRSDSLVSRSQQSCGCLRDTIQGKSRTKLHQIWQSIIQRCCNPSDKHYKNYGGRGIYISADWKDFNNFYRDMGEPPEYSDIHRINNDDGYHKLNCIWLDRSDHRKLHNNERRTNATRISNGKASPE